MASSVEEATVNHPKLREALQAILDDLSERYNMTVAAGYVDATTRMSLVAGVANKWTGTPMTNRTLIPLGSAAKPFTSVLLLQYVEQGKISLDDLATDWVDDLLMAEGNITLSMVMGPPAQNVTIRDLLSMTSGMSDYDDAYMKSYTKEHRGEDISPVDYLLDVDGAETHDFSACARRDCARYSGINYILVGYVLTKLQGKKHWYELDQMEVFPPHLKDRYQDIRFSGPGPCSQYPEVAHQYESELQEGVRHIQDSYELSCLNGWTMGNIMTTPGDLATFHYDLHTLAPTGEGFVSSETVKEMTKMRPMPKDDWCLTRDGTATCSYGMALNNEQAWNELILEGSTSGGAEDFEFIGHGGANWGAGAGPCGYHTRLKFAVCFAFASSEGTNCDMAEANAEGPGEGACRIYEAALKAHGVADEKRPACRRSREVQDGTQCEWVP